jgi:hypothetical protein
MPAGRPLLFDSVEALESAVEAYFESCWEEDWASRTEKDGSLTWTQKLDKDGKPLLKQKDPYTITGLAVALNTSRQTLLNYSERPEFFDTIKRAKDICEKFAEEGMFKGSIPAVPGIFNLKNNYGWVEKQEIDNTHKLQSMDKIKIDGKEIDFGYGSGDTKATESTEQAAEDS